MHLTKDFFVAGIRARNVVNAPFTLLLRHVNEFFTEESSLTFDATTLERLGIPYSLDLIGQTVVCSFESREMPLREHPHTSARVDMRELDVDDVLIRSLEKRERVTPNMWADKPCTSVEMKHELKLETYYYFDGMHPATLPCPLYKMTFDLSEGEYEACKMLPPAVALRMSFSLR